METVRYVGGGMRHRSDVVRQAHLLIEAENY